MTDRAAVEGMVAETERELGPIDLLAANAGIGNVSGNLWESDPADWWRTLEVNVLGVYLTCRAAIPGMLERGGGRIVITGSGAGYLPSASSTSYTSSKAAVNRLGETLANSLAETPVRVFLISPGVRWAWNFRSGLQVVPGFAVPVGFGPSRGSRQVLLYLSFEHPFQKKGQP